MSTSTKKESGRKVRIRIRRKKTRMIRRRRIKESRQKESLKS